MPTYVLLEDIFEEMSRNISYIKLNTYLKKEKELVTLYESKYGPLTTSSPVQTNNWTWNNSPWPWEVQS